jgi:uncharacterized coiled-coil protein SlyX
MSFSFKRGTNAKMDPEILRVVSAVVAENMFEVQSSIATMQEQMSEFQGRLVSLEATAAAATKAPLPAASLPHSLAGLSKEEQTTLQKLSSRLDSLEETAAATTKGLEELLAPSQDRAAQQPVTYYDLRQLEKEVRKLEADLAPAKLVQNMPSAENLQKKFDDIEQICDEVKGSCEDNDQKVTALEDQIEFWRIGWAIFALSALNLKESDRRDCLSRLKDEEERMRRVKFGAASESPGNNSSPHSRFSRPRIPTISSGVIVPPCLNRSQPVHPQPSPQPQLNM